MKLEEAIERLKRKKNVVAIFLFGSYLKDKEDRPFKDIDLGVVIHPYDKYAAADAALALPPKFDVVIMNEAPPHILYAIVKKGKLIWRKEGVNLAAIIWDLGRKVRENWPVLKYFGWIDDEE